MPSIGDILDQRYEILAELGAGGFATVYKARHIGLLSDHAVKVLHGHLAEDTELRARFLAEGRIQARLLHPNIVAVTDIVTSPLPGLVMEFVEGETLGDYVAGRGGKLVINELRALFLPVLDAVATAHAAGVVHRDLKPDNVIVGKRADGGLEPRVTDFGIAKVLDESVVGGAKQRTKTGMRMGTLHYMSPEQVRGAADIDARTDVFSLGAILYELVTGRAAFATDSEYETMTNIVNGRYEAPERVVAGLPPAIAACIAGALAPDVAKRTASCVAFREGLRRALEGPVAKGETVRATRRDAAAEASDLHRRLAQFHPVGGGGEADVPGDQCREVSLPAGPGRAAYLSDPPAEPGAATASAAGGRGTVPGERRPALPTPFRTPAPRESGTSPHLPVGGIGETSAQKQNLITTIAVAAFGVCAVVVCVGITSDVFYAFDALMVLGGIGGAVYTLACVAKIVVRAGARP